MTDKKSNIKTNLTTVVDKLAKLVSFLTVFVFASYGLRQLLHSLNDQIAFVITVVFIALLVYIMFRKQ